MPPTKPHRPNSHLHSSSTKLAPFPQPNKKVQRTHKGFTIASADDDDDDDDDAWVSSESGAVTPDVSNQSSEEEDTEVIKTSATPTMKRVETMRQDDFFPSKRTRPSSTHSVQAPLRPHPLIRGQSFGPQRTGSNGDGTLAPATTTDVTVSSSPPISSTPTNPHPTSWYPDPGQSQHRRTSVSSARSVATLPVLPTRERESDDPGRVSPSLNSQSFYSSTKALRDSREKRTRTLSTLSSSSSSAAISSLVHAFPAAVQPHPATRPPSPRVQLVCYFPIKQSHSNLHPLLPPPYLTNHLTVLAHRTPIRESYDRVVRAKMGLGPGW